jgi:hypothetical protein
VFTISSMDGPLVAAQGFSQIDPGQGTVFNDITFTANGFTFADLIFSVRGTGTLTVTDQTGATALNGTASLDPGLDTFIALTTSGLAEFSSLTLSLSGGTFQQVGQVRVSGVSVVPGPIAGAGLPALMALGGFVWARRRKATATA